MAVEPDYIENVPKTDLLRMFVALSTEVYALSDRLVALEETLEHNGIDISALDEPTQPAVYDEARKARRDAFVARVFEAVSKSSGRSD